MPDLGMGLSHEEMRRRALHALDELADGSFAERMRVEAAARIIVTLRRVAVLAAGGEFGGATPSGPLAELAARWDATATTASEFAGALTPAELSLLTEGAPPWAEAQRARG
ncbi:hypothetical protein ACI6QG_15380 [Roseococcus sp. DSY-14]|uniref:hypothetical protein n=1 Tax=Roseococcus sp. DSY-14 TaxID=3369650 RepID=UPI00387B223E